MPEKATAPTAAYGVVTPERVVLDFPIASLGSRSLALLLDSLLLGVAWTLLAILPLSILSVAVAKSGSVAWVVALWLIISFVLTWGYFSVFEIALRGQTPGKQMARLRVIAATGHPASAGQILTRNLVRIVDALPLTYSVGAVCMLLNSRSQRLGDLAAGTIVVHESDAALPPPVGAATPAALAAAGPLTAADLELLERFLLRRAALPEAARAELEDKIRDHLAPRLAPEARELAASPGGLESLAAAVRASLGYVEST